MKPCGLPATGALRIACRHCGTHASLSLLIVSQKEDGLVGLEDPGRIEISSCVISADPSPDGVPPASDNPVLCRRWPVRRRLWIRAPLREKKSCGPLPAGRMGGSAAHLHSKDMARPSCAPAAPALSEAPWAGGRDSRESSGWPPARGSLRESSWDHGTPGTPGHPQRRPGA